MSNQKTKEKEMTKERQETEEKNDNKTGNKASEQTTKNQSGDKKKAAKPKKKGDKKSQLKNRIDELEQEVAELKDKNLRLFAEFDNFRKRSARERNEMLNTAGQEVIRELLPILDDIKRAEGLIENAEDIESVKKGYQLITKKLISTLRGKGLKEMETIGHDFNPDLHEAITEIPAPNDEEKGKVIDEVEKGYYLNERILRYAKVVVGK